LSSLKRTLYFSTFDGWFSLQHAVRMVHNFVYVYLDSPDELYGETEC